MRYLRPIGLFTVISSGILMILGSATTPTRHPRLTNSSGQFQNVLMIESVSASGLQLKLG